MLCSALRGTRVAERTERALDARRLDLLDEPAALEPLRVVRIRSCAEQRSDDSRFFDRTAGDCAHALERS